ncbi:MAG: hypothetical protein KZQ99_15660 [Candidatus Thiodiazotropha sp. (ex Dulcina madagascariensis)]|nr:hypothetical protein [Candidatus Thiodiazotropha sp. (ex Dulcina madagascariensis)]
MKVKKPLLLSLFKAIGRPKWAMESPSCALDRQIRRHHPVVGGVVVPFSTTPIGRGFLCHTKMPSEIITALIASGSAITLACASYWFTKKRERESQLRKEKLEHYKELAICLSGIIHGESTPDSQRAYSLIRNKLNLIAPYSVIKVLRSYSEATNIRNPNRATGELHDKLLSNLFYEIRKDLGMRPKDDPTIFKIGLWASGQGQRNEP